MPNWCSNTVLIKGQKEEIRNLTVFLTDDESEFSFQKIDPCPEALNQASAPNRSEQNAAFNTKKYGAPDWYSWRVKNWGTKWNSDGASVEIQEADDEDTLIAIYNFSTAWSPPIPIYQKLAKMFPNTNIFVNYDESGVDFSGWRSYKNGEETRAIEYDQSYYSINTFMDPDVHEVWEYL